MSKAKISKVKARAILVDGKPYSRKADGSLVPLKGKTDGRASTG